MKNKLVQLIRDNIKNAGNSAVRVETAGDEATLYMYGVISDYWGDVSATAVIAALAGITASNVNLRINSPGGDVFEARAIMTAINAHPAKFTAHIDGLAASAATGVCMACDSIKMTAGAQFMIHEAWTLGLGNKGELRATADLLEKVDNDLAHDYVVRTGKPIDDIVAAMLAETWFTATEAKEFGLVDEVIETAKSKASNIAWDLSAYKNAPKPSNDDAEQQTQRLAAERAQRERHLALLQRNA